MHTFNRKRLLRISFAGQKPILVDTQTEDTNTAGDAEIPSFRASDRPTRPRRSALFRPTVAGFGPVLQGVVGQPVNLQSGGPNAPESSHVAYVRT